MSIACPHSALLHCYISCAVLGMFFRPFAKSDPRLKVALHEPEPLIHFALVCGAKSCPPIKTFSAHVSLDLLPIILWFLSPSKYHLGHTKVIHWSMDFFQVRGVRARGLFFFFSFFLRNQDDQKSAGTNF